MCKSMQHMLTYPSSTHFQVFLGLSLFCCCSSQRQAINFHLLVLNARENSNLINLHSAQRHSIKLRAQATISFPFYFCFCRLSSFFVSHSIHRAQANRKNEINAEHVSDDLHALEVSDRLAGRRRLLFVVVAKNTRLASDFYNFPMHFAALDERRKKVAHFNGLLFFFSVTSRITKQFQFQCINY